MPKVLLSKFPDAISNTLARIRDGIVAAGTDGIVSRVIDNKVDFQVEVVMDVNSIPRTQEVDTSQNKRTVSGGAELVTEVRGVGTTTSSEASAEAGTEASDESGTAAETGSDTTSTSSGTEVLFYYITT